jgi:hypothetical protein
VFGPPKPPSSRDLCVLLISQDLLFLGGAPIKNASHSSVVGVAYPRRLSAEKEKTYP